MRREVGASWAVVVGVALCVWSVPAAAQDAKGPQTIAVA